MSVTFTARLGALAGACALTGCATITTGTTQTISINTDPSGADCSFSRDGNMVARVNPTPGPINVGKASGSISVLCRKDGFLDTAGVVGSQFQAMTFGNILLGGIVGVVVDAASGAMMKYPEAVTFQLVPVLFNTATERDAFFANMRDTFLTEYAEVVARIKQSCTGSSCETQLKAAEAGKEAKLAEIEQKRLLAKVRT